MRSILLALPALICLSVPATSPVRAQGACCYLPQYRKLLRQVSSLPPGAALKLLYAYQADPANDNPEGCDSDQLDRMISVRETAMVRLVGPTATLAPCAVFHCDALDPRSLECNGSIMDGTGQPDARGVLPPPTKKRLLPE